MGRDGNVTQRDAIDEVLAHIEAQLFSPLSVTSLAAVAGLSPYHFSRLFTARMGDSVMSFVRRRRMEEAAVRLAEERPPALAELAFDCGFESQEAFTRAFARTFGVTPGRFKRDPSSGLRETERHMSKTSKANVTLQGDPIRHPGFSVAGVSAQIEAAHKEVIPTLWPKLFQHLAKEKTSNWRTYGVCWGADESQGTFNYMAAVEVASGAKPPQGLEAKAIPAQSYLVFRLTLDGSDLHGQMQAAAREIWGEQIPKSGRRLAKGPDLEVYPRDFDPTRAGSTVDFWVPVEN
jgi:AraC family transcriptional regulator